MLHNIFTPAFNTLLNYSNVNHLLMYCLINANDSKALFKSINDISIATGLSSRTIRTNLNKLVKSGEIFIKTTSEHHLIRLLKYDDYIIKSGINDKPYFYKCTFGPCIRKRAAYDHKQKQKELEQWLVLSGKIKTFIHPINWLNFSDYVLMN